jgi:2-furoyl-CoA dehydrogenase large subunit
MVHRKLVGNGSVTVAAPRDGLWDALLDPVALKDLIQGAESVEMPEPDLYVARLSYGVGTFRSRYVVEIRLSRLDRPSSLRLSGHSNGALGRGEAMADVTLTESGPNATVIAWDYSGVVSGTVALAGMALLGKAASHFVDRFFVGLSTKVAKATA